MIKIGITGQNGFVGSALYNTLGLQQDLYERIDFEKEFFEDDGLLDSFVSKCDVIVHLAAMNRHPDAEVIYKNNVQLVAQLVASLQRTRSTAHVLFSSSSQEEKDNLYGKSKREGREMFASWAANHGGTFTGLVIPNVFGPFGQPFYNSFIATFCHQLVSGAQPEIAADAEVNLIYVGDLVDEMIGCITARKNDEKYIVPHRISAKVSEVLAKINSFREIYYLSGEIPVLETAFEYQLFNTFRSYIDHGTHFPVKFTQNTDSRGTFVEIIRLGIGGQCSFSTTVPGVTRGNHFHTRKIERFAVIKGTAQIQLRKIGTSEVLNFELNGEEPAYVDMPIWYTHNIKNTGTDELVTIFWINEPYDPADADTYFVEA